MKELELFCESITKARECDKLFSDLLFMWAQKERETLVFPGNEERLQEAKGYEHQMLSLGATPPIKPKPTNIFKTIF